MKEVQWKMKEDFVFPTTVGIPKNTDTLNVTPRFTIDRSTDNLKMTGIYHLAMNVEFDNEKTKELDVESAIRIDDVDIEGSTGYFEYAVPFNIDLPPEASDPLNLVTLNPSHELGPEGQLAIIWEVVCTYNEVITVPDQLAAEEAERAEAQVNSNSEVSEAVAESEQVDRESQVAVEQTSFSEGDEVLSFLSELDDGITATLFRLNDVLVQGERQSG